MSISALLAVTADAAAAPTQKTKSSTREAEQKRQPSGPLIAVVSIDKQRVTVFDRNGQVTSSPISSGQPGHDTPRGIFSVIEKHVEHYSNLYNDASMPYMQRITWSGVALHAGNLPGYPASHGCIRLPYSFSTQLYGMTNLGTRVLVTNQPVAPAPFSHPRLFSPRDIADPRVAALVAPKAVPVVPEQQVASAAPVRPLEGGMRLGVAPAGEGTVAAPVTGAPPKVTVSRGLLDEARTNARGQLAAQTKEAEKAKALHAAKQKELGRIAQALTSARRAKDTAERQLMQSQKAIDMAKGGALLQRAEKKKQMAEEQLAKAVLALQAAEAAGGEAKAAEEQIVSAEKAWRVAAAARAETASLVRELDLKARPVSVFISRKTQRLYVRQGFEPVFDVPVTIANPQQPLGTHLYTAMDVSAAAGTAGWSVVTVNDGSHRAPPTKADRRNAVVDVPMSSKASAATALDRITIPEDAIQRISESLRTGSSLIVSDEGISHETGKGTDFVILTR